MKSRFPSQRLELTPQVDGQQTDFTVKSPGGSAIEYLPESLEVVVNGIDQGEPGTNFVELTSTTFRFTAFILRPPTRLVVFYIPKNGWCKQS